MAEFTELFSVGEIGKKREENRGANKNREYDPFEEVRLSFALSFGTVKDVDFTDIGAYSGGDNSVGFRRIRNNGER